MMVLLLLLMMLMLLLLCKHTTAMSGDSVSWYSKEGARMENTSPEVPVTLKDSKGKKRFALPSFTDFRLVRVKNVVHPGHPALDLAWPPLQAVQRVDYEVWFWH